MMAWSGVGAIAGALVVAWLGRFRHMGLTALLVQLAAGALIVAFALTRLLWLSHVLLLVTGAAMMITFSLFTSLVQLVAPNEMRGRVMSVYMVAFRGGMPLGSLVTGVVVDQAGAPLALAVNGALLTAVAAWFLVRRARPNCADSETSSALERLEQAGRAAADARPDQRALSSAGECTDAGAGARRAADHERGLCPRSPPRLTMRHASGCGPVTTYRAGTGARSSKRASSIDEGWCGVIAGTRPRCRPPTALDRALASPLAAATLGCVCRARDCQQATTSKWRAHPRRLPVRIFTWTSSAGEPTVLVIKMQCHVWSRRANVPR